MGDIVGQVKIDFEVIPTYEVFTLIVADNSDWKYLENNEAVIGIKVPNSSNEILNAFVKKSLNIFNSNNLGVSCFKDGVAQEYVAIPDGIYTIKLYSSSEYKNKEKFFFKTDSLQLEVDKAFVKLGTQYKPEDDNIIQSLLTIQFFIDETHAAIRIGENLIAQRNFETAQELLKKHQDCKNCY